MSGKLLLTGILCLALLGMAQASFNEFSRTGYESFLGKFDPVTGDWYAVAIAAVMVCFFFNVAVYMAGYAFESEHLKKYAKAEFLQVTASALLIFWAVALLYELSGGGATGTEGGGAFAIMGNILGKGASSIACSAVPGGRYMLWDSREFGGGAIGAFKCKVQEKITALDRQYANIEQANRGTERLTSTCVMLFGFPVWCWDWDLDLHKKVEESHLLATKIVSLLMPLHAQYVLADYIQSNMLSVFLPLGLLLRIVPVTRGVGGFFIAMGIGFFFVWPTFTVLTDPTFVRTDDMRVTDKMQGVCYTGFRGVAVVFNNAFTNAGGFGENELSIASGNELLYQMTIGSIFYPFVALVVTLIFVRAMTPLLGGDTGELMKMVSRLG